MTLKKYKFTVEYTLNIDDITEESIDKNLSQSANYESIKDDPDYLENGRTSQRLLHALLSHDAVLKKIIPKIFFNSLEIQGKDLLKSYIKEHYPQTHYDEEYILYPVINSLSDEDREFYSLVAASGMFYEHTENFFEAFSLSIEKVTQTES